MSEYHGEWVPAPCFMAPQGSMKYVFAHGAGSQLLDLAADPDERVNLAGRAETAEVERRLRAAILARLDPEAIAADLATSRRERLLMRDAMNAEPPTRWDLIV